MGKGSRIYIGSKPKRGSKKKWPLVPNTTRVDVTSANLKYRKDLSPLFVGPTTAPDGTVFDRFENAWQYSKVYPQLGHYGKLSKTETPKWFEWRKRGQTKLRNGKGIRTDSRVSKLKKVWRDTGKPWTPMHSRWGNEQLGYIEARKKIYVPEYLKLIRKTKTIKQLKKSQDSYLFIDLDGPPKVEELSGELLEKMLNDPNHLFGHGYCVAAIVAGLDDALEEMCKK